ncbi:MAG: diacylglycerol kinase family protein, partial [Methyloceanibacter sp.]
MNAGAGAFNQKLAADVESELASTFAHHGVAAKIVFVDGEDLQNSAKSALAQAKRGEIDAVVIGGGDGSIRTVAGVLAGTNIALGVLPLGTLN